MSLYINGFNNPYQAASYHGQYPVTSMAVGEEGGEGPGWNRCILPEPMNPSANAINTRDAFNLCGQADRACSPWGGDGRVTQDELSQLGQNLGRMKQLVDMLKGWAPQGQFDGISKYLDNQITTNNFLTKNFSLIAGQDGDASSITASDLFRSAGRDRNYQQITRNELLNPPQDDPIIFW